MSELRFVDVDYCKYTRLWNNLVKLEPWDLRKGGCGSVLHYIDGRQRETAQRATPRMTCGYRMPTDVLLLAHACTHTHKQRIFQNSAHSKLECGGLMFYLAHIVDSHDTVKS